MGQEEEMGQRLGQSQGAEEETQQRWSLGKKIQVWTAAASHACSALEAETDEREERLPQAATSPISLPVVPSLVSPFFSWGTMKAKF